MEVFQMRAAIRPVYSGKKWQERVKMMKDSQVIAIYNSFMRTGKFEEKQKSKQSDYIQMTLADYIK